MIIFYYLLMFYILGYIIMGIVQPSAALIRLATQVSSDKELSRLYDSGYVDAESWCHRELCDDAHLKKNQ